MFRWDAGAPPADDKVTAAQRGRDRLGLRREDPDLVLDAMAYVEAVHTDLTAENSAPSPGVEGRVVSAILADPAVSDYVRSWAGERCAQEASAASLPRPPIDATYERVRELLRRTGDEPRRKA